MWKRRISAIFRTGCGCWKSWGAITTDEQATAYKLTPLGRQLSQLPVDPRLARMVLEAQKHGCVREAMIITSALSIQDPRERPMDKQQASDEKHRRFHDKESDFLAFVNLWNYLGEQQKALSSNQFRRQCRVDFLNYLRVREWQDIYTQLRQVVKELGIPVNSEPAEIPRNPYRPVDRPAVSYRDEGCG
ncbi:hypothetical protein HR12_04120 [Microbacterium sp. SUBG005]|nr:hypothetical protein HR12_04120 [Microbacterium sp. SUBG005]